MSLPSIDPDLLRSFTAIAEDGSFTRAAERVGRTQSAVSMQMQRLEALLGQTLLLRGKGGAVSLTPHGKYLLDRAHDVLELNDQIIRVFRTPQVLGTVRLGTPDDYALRYVPPVLKRFAETHPGVEVAVRCAPSNELADLLVAGELDLTLMSEGNQPRGWPTVELWRGPLRWITAERATPHRLDPLPLAITGELCGWRQAAEGALREAGIRFRLAYTSATLLGTHAPVIAGLAVTVSPMTWLPEGLRALPPGERLPLLPDTAIVLARGRAPRQPVTDVLAEHITQTFATEMRRAA